MQVQYTKVQGSIKYCIDITFVGLVSVVLPLQIPVNLMATRLDEFVSASKYNALQY